MIENINIEKIKEVYRKYNTGIVLSIISIIVWCCLTLTNPYIRTFHHDEIWAYNIASDLSSIEIIKLMRYEIHTFLWYFLIKPFTYFPPFYPYIIKGLNWLFAFIFVCLFHTFAPINRFLKILITFTMPFFIIYPLEGRCYSLGIMLLFTLTAFYKYRLKFPVLFSIIVFFTANTNLMSLLGAFVFGYLFFIDLIKENAYKNKNYKNIVIPSLILILTAVIVIIQLHNPVIAKYVDMDFIKAQRLWFLSTFYFDYYNPPQLKYLAYFIICFFVPVTLIINIINDKHSSIRYLFFVLFTIVFINLIFAFCYRAFMHHLYYVYVYMIILYWLKADNDNNFSKTSLAYKSFSVLILLSTLLFIFPKNNDFFCTPYSSIKENTENIINQIPKGSTIYLFLEGAQFLIEDMKDDYNLLTLYGEKIPSFNAYKNIYQDEFITPNEITPANENSYYIAAGLYINYYLEHFPEYDMEIFKHPLFENEQYFVYKLN